MNRIAYVAFVPFKKKDCSKETLYKFILSDDRVEEGDIIEDPRFYVYMQVVRIENIPTLDVRVINDVVYDKDCDKSIKIR